MWCDDIEWLEKKVLVIEVGGPLGEGDVTVGSYSAPCLPHSAQWLLAKLSCWGYSGKDTRL